MAQRCTRYKRVRSKFGGTVRRCASYRGRSSNGRRRKYRRRGKAPFNKGRTCQAWGRAMRSGKSVRVCRSYGGGRGARRREARGSFLIPGTSMAVRPSRRPDLYGRGSASSVASAYRGSQEAARRYGSRQRSWLQRLLGTGG
jgi:hypothetical protein